MIQRLKFHQTRQDKTRQGREKQASMEEVLKTERITVERKNFIFDLKENPRGKFLRITEDVNGRRDAIIIPAPGLEDFRRVIDLMIEAHENSMRR
jgi:hypothetical protein